VKVQSSFQVDHGDNAQKTLKISLFGDWDRRDQHECVNPTHEEGEDRDHVHDTRVDALKLITGNECTGEPETKALNDNEPVINLNQEISQEDSSGVDKFTADSLKPNVQSENLPNPMKEPIGIPNKFATGDIEYRNHDTVVSKPIISIINFALGNSRSTIKKMALYG